MNGFLRKLLVTVAASFLMLPNAFACAVCYGEPDAPMTRGLTCAIIVLAGIVGTVLTGVLLFFVRICRRAAALEQGGQAAENLQSPG